MIGDVVDRQELPRQDHRSPDNGLNGWNMGWARVEGRLRGLSDAPSRVESIRAGPGNVPEVAA